MKRHNLAHPFFITTIVDARNQEAAINWIIDNQLGRRNLTETQRSYLIGKRYNTEKQLHGGDHKSEEYAEKSKPQSDGLILPIKTESKPLVNTAQKIADQTGVSKATVERNAEVAKAVDEIKTIDPEFMQKILTEEIKLPKQDITELVKKPVIEQNQT